MAKVRQARRCRARRTDGQPCRAYAIVGGTVCRAHGGAAGQVRAAALRRRIENQVTRAAYVALQRYREQATAWQIRRILTTAEQLGINPEQVTPAHIRRCFVLHGIPDEPRPDAVDCIDRRFGPRIARTP